MTATLVQALPEGPEWMYEVKLDGYRALILKSGGRVQIRSRNDKNLSGAYPGVDAAASRLNIDSVVLDGEIVALDAKGRPSFQALQHRAAHPRHSVVYYAFDVPQLNGVDLTRLPLDQRKAQLPGIVKESGLRISQELPGTAQQVIAAVQRLGLEGVIAKRRDSRYDAGMRRGAWVKLKLDKQQEFVIGGYRPGSHGVDALIVGYYEDKHLRYAGKVRAGFTPHIRREVFEALKPLLSAEGESATYAQIGNSLGLTEAAVRSALHRLRQRSRELFRSEIAHTVASPEEIDDEIRYLFTALSA